MSIHSDIRGMFVPLRKLEQARAAKSTGKQLPEIVLFGDSLTEWSFDDTTQGFGLHLESLYAGKARIVNEGSYFKFFGSYMPEEVRT